MVGSIIFLLLVGAGVVGIVIGVQKNKKKASESPIVEHEVVHEVESPVVEVVKVEEKPKVKKATKTAVKKKTTKTK